MIQVELHVGQHPVGLAKQVTESLIYIVDLCESKVVDKVAVEQRLDPVDSWMISASFQPDVPTEVVFARSDRHEAPAGLEDDPGLLCIDVNWADSTNSPLQRIKDLANLGGLSNKVLID